jgi:hypothetical protein
MATHSQIDLFRRYERMFGRTSEWRIVSRNENFTCMNARDAYAFLGHLMDAVKYLKFTRLPRWAGLPQTPEERTALYERAFVEERVARLACPDDERETWCSDTRPSPFDERSYFEQNPQILEDLEVDGYLRLPHTYNDHDSPRLLVS